MAMGLPVVASAAAATGIAATPDETIAVGESDAELAAAVIALARDPAAARAMGQGARARVMAGHDWPAMLAALPGLLGLSPKTGVRDAA